MFEWDEEKRAVNLVKHGVDFKRAKAIFDGITLEAPDERCDYGEIRFGAYGEAEGEVLFVVYTWRGRIRRIISARKAGCMNEKRTTPTSGKKTQMNNKKTDKKIKQAVADDPDTFIPDDAWFARAQIVMPKSKEMVSLRLDHDVLSWFKKTGRGYQTRINAVLKAFIETNEHRIS